MLQINNELFKRIQYQKRQTQNEVAIIQQQWQSYAEQKDASQPLKAWDWTTGPMRFRFSIQQAIIDPTSTVTPPVPDPTLLWFGVLPPPAYPQRQLLIVFRPFQYTVYQTQAVSFPKHIHICIDQLNGYNDVNGNITTRVATLELSNIAINQFSAQTYDLTYSLNQMIYWQIPLTVTNLKIRVIFDDQITFQPLPLEGPMTVAFQIQRFYTPNIRMNEFAQKVIE